MRSPSRIPGALAFPLAFMTLSLIILTLPALADEKAPPDPTRVTLDRLFAPDDFKAGGFGPARWLEDGGYTTCQRAEGKAGGRDIVRIDPATGTRTVLVAATDLVPEGREKALSISDYIWSDAGDKLLVFTNTRRVWRRHTRGDYWVLDLATKKLAKLGGDGPEATLMFAKFSPDGSRVAYVRERDLYVESLTDPTITRLTRDGSDLIINGTTDWVYEEEFALRDGFRWSPDGKNIAFWRFDTSEVPRFQLINYSAGFYPTIKTFSYPKTGHTNSDCRVGVVSAAGGPVTWMDVPGKPRDHYIPRMEWADSPKELVIQQMNRLQNHNRVFLADAATGAVRCVFEDRDEAWVEVCDDLVWLEDGNRFTFLSERDGWRHLYAVRRDGGEIRLLTPGDYDVISIACVDEAGGFAYFIASPDDPKARYLFRVPLGSGGKAERITPEAMRGTNAYQMSGDARFAIHTHSAFGCPPTLSLVSLPDHGVVRVLQDNAHLKKQVAALTRGAEEFFRIDIGDGVLLDAWCIKPPHFDPAKKWPLFFTIYGEPAGQTVLDQWGGFGYLWNLMLARKGYVVISVDNRGTPGPRGRDWRKSIYRQVGILASKDQAAALKKLLATRSWADGDRVGIWGWSGGGSMSLNMIFRYPELYKMAMSVAPVPNQRFYDTIYQERYMGLPDDNAEGYREGSPLTHAKHLKGDLLLIHGTGDDNCHYQGMEALIDELIKHRKAFDMMAYPNRGHSIYEGAGTRRHLYELLTRYLEEHLNAGPKE